MNIPLTPTPTFSSVPKGKPFPIKVIPNSEQWKQLLEDEDKKAAPYYRVGKGLSNLGLSLSCLGLGAWFSSFYLPEHLENKIPKQLIPSSLVGGVAGLLAGSKIASKKTKIPTIQTTGQWID